ARSPAASAIRYDGIGWGSSNRNDRSLREPSPANRSALMTAVRSSGTRTVAAYVTRTAGESWSGIHDRAWIACDWVNRNGALPPAVPFGSTHWRAVDLAVVR